MMRTFSIVLNASRLDSLMVNIPGRASAILDKAAFDVERIAKPLTNIDTGAMRSSIYVSGASGGSQYSSAASQAASLRPGVNILPEVRPGNRLERVIGVSVEYAYWQELQKPFLEPAIEQVRPQITAAWSKLFA